MKYKNISKFLIFLFVFTLIIFTSACDDDNSNGIEITGTRDLEMTVGTVIPDLSDGIGVTGFTFDNLDSLLDIDISNVNTNLVGEYEIIYTLSFEDVEYTASIILSVVDGAVGNAPYIFGVEDITYIIGDDLPNLLDGVTANDSKFGDLSFIIDLDLNGTDFTQVGNYEIIYHVQNEDGYHYTTTANVEVVWGESFLDLPDPFVIAESNGFYGIIDLEGDIIVPLEYSIIQYNGDDMLKLEKGGETLFYNFVTDEFIQYEYSTVGYFYEGLASAKDEFDNWGYINTDGEAVIPFIYDFTYNFYNGLAEVRMGDNYGIIDFNGNTTIDIMYSNIYRIGNSYFVGTIESTNLILDSSGNTVHVLSSDDINYFMYDFEAGLGYVYEIEIDGFTGLIDSEMNFIIEPEYLYILPTIFGEYDGYIQAVYEGRTDLYYVYSDFNLKDITYLTHNGQYLLSSGNLGSKIFDMDTHELYFETEYFNIQIFNLELGLYEVKDSNGLYGIIDADESIVFPFTADSINFLIGETTRFRDEDDLHGILDNTGTEITTSRYADIGSFVDGFAIVLNEDGLYGYISEDGTEIVSPQFIQANNFSNGFAAVTTGYDINYNPIKIFIGTDGNFISEYRYGEVRNFVNGYAAVAVYDYEIGLTWGFINEDGVKVVDTIYYGVQDFDNGYAVTKEYQYTSASWGIVDTTGAVIIPNEYLAARNFSEGFAAVQLATSYWRFLDVNAVDQFGVNYINSGDFNDGLAPVQITSSPFTPTWTYIDSSGDRVEETYWEAGNYSNGLAAVKLTDEVYSWGYINTNAEVVIDAVYKEANEFKDGFAQVLGLYHYVIDTEGNELYRGGYQLTETYYGYYAYNPYQSNYRVYIYIVDGNLNIYYTIDGIDYTVQTDGDKWRMFDENNVQLIAPLYDYIEFMEYSHTWQLRDGSYYGAAKVNGIIIAQPIYDIVFYDDGNSYAGVKILGNYGMNTEFGEIIADPIYDNIDEQWNYFVVYIGDKRGIVNVEGEMVVPIIYDSLTIYSLSGDVEESEED